MADPVTEFISILGLGLARIGENLLGETARVVPGLLVAIVLIIVGVIAGKIAKEIFVKILQGIRIDQWIEEQNLHPAIGKTPVSDILGSLSKWYIIGVFLGEAAIRVELKVVQTLISSLVYYIPLAVSAIIVLLFGLLAARYVRNKISATEHRYRSAAGLAVEAAILLFTVLLSLTYVVGDAKTQILLQAVYFFLNPFLWAAAIITGIVVGISFGVAFKEDIKKLGFEAKKFANKFR